MARQGLQLDPDMKEVLDRAKARTGIAYVELVRRLLRFFDRQPDVVQAEMLGTLPPSLRERSFMEHVLAHLDQPPAAAEGPALDAAREVRDDAANPAKGPKKKPSRRTRRVNL